jgi:hypothetical protein
LHFNCSLGKIAVQNTKSDASPGNRSEAASTASDRESLGTQDGGLAQASSNVCRNQLPATGCCDACTCLAASQASLGRPESTRLSSYTAVNYLIYCPTSTLQDEQLPGSCCCHVPMQCAHVQQTCSWQHVQQQSKFARDNLIIICASCWLLLLTLLLLRQLLPATSSALRGPGRTALMQVAPATPNTTAQESQHEAPGIGGWGIV